MKPEKKNFKKSAFKTAKPKSKSKSKSKSKLRAQAQPKSKSPNRQPQSTASATAKDRSQGKSKSKPVTGKPRQQSSSADRPEAQPQLRSSDVPSVLLEGDRPGQAGPSGPGERYALGPQGPGSHPYPVEEMGELPDAYGTQRLLITARDPHWLYAHWDLTREQLRQYNARSADGHLILQVFEQDFEGEPCARVHVHPESRNWFVHVGQGGARYVAEIGFREPDGQWIPVAHSGATLTPPDTASDDTTVRFETIPVDLPFDRLLGALKSAFRENLPLAEALRQMRTEGHEVLPDQPALESGHWSAEQEQAMAELISMDQIRRVWMGSLEITELVRRHLGQELASVGAAQVSQAQPQPSAGGGVEAEEAWSAAISAITSPAGGRPTQQKGFWFNVNAELIIYGATERDATVRIGDRHIRLRPDGSFSFRFALPDGEYHLPVVAVAGDESEARTAELSFKRATAYSGEVGTHPQSAHLKKPDPDNVE